MSARHSSFLSWPLLVFVIVTIAVLLSGERPLLDGDTYMHIGIGDWIIAHQTVPNVDVFSHTMTGKPWMAHEWLAEVILAVVYRMGGWTGLVLLAGVCTATTLALMLRFMLPRMIPLYALGFAALTYLALLTHLLARPHVLTWPLIVLWFTGLLNAFEQKRMPSWWLLPVMVLWVNLHGGFILGFALLLPVAAEAVMQAGATERHKVLWQWIVFSGATLVFSLINPAGWNAHTFLWNLMGNSQLSQAGEWRATDLAKFVALQVWVYALIVLGLLGMLRLPALRLLLVLVLLYQALAHVRYVSIFALLVPLILAAPFGQCYQRWKRKHSDNEGSVIDDQHILDGWFNRWAKPAGVVGCVVGTAVVAAVAVICAFRGVNSPEPSTLPEAAVNAVLAGNVRGKVFNHDGAGGYLILRGIPAYTDGRVDLYGESFMQNQSELMTSTDPVLIQDRLDAAQVGWVLLPAQSGLAVMLTSLPGWQSFYADEHAKVFSRASIH